MKTTSIRRVGYLIVAAAMLAAVPAFAQVDVAVVYATTGEDVDSDEGPLTNAVFLSTPAIKEPYSVFIAKLSGGGVTPTNDTAVVRGDNAGIPIVAAREGDIGDDAQTGNPMPGPFAKFGEPVVNASGFAAFTAKLRVGGSVASTNDDVLAVGYNTFPRKIAVHFREHDPAPDLAGQFFSKLNWFLLTDNGQIVFGAETSDFGAVPVKKQGVWAGIAEDVSAPNKVVATGDTVLGKTVSVIAKPKLSFQTRIGDNATGLIGLQLKFTDNSSSIVGIQPP